MVARSQLDHNTLADQAAVTADEAIKSTKRAADSALDQVSDRVEDARSYVSPMINRASEQVNALAQRGVDAARTASYVVRDRALQAGDTTAGYIKNDPIKAVLIAAATGAVLMGLVSLFSRSSRDRDY